ncbi:MAG: hypothetical protein WDO13_09110 [Verrucomicrobiota bacterium]
MRTSPGVRWRAWRISRISEGGDGQRLLAKHVLAGVERGDDRGRVHLVRRADVDAVDLLELEQVVEVGEDVGNL